MSLPGVITLMFIFLTVCILCGYKFDISLLLVPVVTLFTITQLRGTLPGAPAGFGRYCPSLNATLSLNIWFLSLLGAIVGMLAPRPSRVKIFNDFVPV